MRPPVRKHSPSLEVDHCDLVLVFQIDIDLAVPVRRQVLRLAAQFNRRINHRCLGIGVCLKGDQYACVAASD